MAQIEETLIIIPEHLGSQASTWHKDKRAEPEIRYSSDPELDKYDPPEPVPCQYCGALRYTRAFEFGNRIVWDPAGPQRCTCPEAHADYEKLLADEKAAEEARVRAEQEKAMRERVARIIKNSGINTRFLRRTFDTFELTNSNRKAFIVCKEYADTFEKKRPGANNPDPGRNGLFITGPKGIGKTHLAAAIANQIMNQGTAVICMTMIDLLDGIRKTFDPATQATSSSVLAIYKDAPLLIIDDIGKEPPTEWAISTIYNIINGRYEALMPTIVKTNYSDELLIQRLTPPRGDAVTADATIDRLREMCSGLLMAGPSWRSR